MKLTWTKVAPGHWEARTGLRDSVNPYERYEVVRCDGTYAYPSGGWFLTYPSQIAADSVFPTMREATIAAQVWHDIDVEACNADAEKLS